MKIIWVLYWSTLYWYIINTNEKNKLTGPGNSGQVRFRFTQLMGQLWSGWQQEHISVCWFIRNELQVPHSNPPAATTRYKMNYFSQLIRFCRSREAHETWNMKSIFISKLVQVKWNWWPEARWLSYRVKSKSLDRKLSSQSLHCWSSQRLHYTIRRVNGKTFEKNYEYAWCLPKEDLSLVDAMSWSVTYRDMDHWWTFVYEMFFGHRMTCAT